MTTRDPPDVHPGSPTWQLAPLVPVSNGCLAQLGVGGIERRQRFRRLARDRWIPADYPALDERDRIRLLVSAVPAGAVLSHETAARWYRLPADRRNDGEAPHVTVPPGSSLQRTEFTVHVASLPFDDLDVFEGAPVTAPPRTFLDIAQRLDRERLVVIGDALLARDLTTVDELEHRIADARRRRGVRVARDVVPLLDGRSQSPAESIVRLRLYDAKLPPPRLRHPIRLGPLLVHPDLAWPEARVALEYEGRQHAEEEQFRMDLDRYSALAANGWLVIRASSRDLAGGSQVLIARVRTALAQRGVA